jgi:hypothetical protein
MALVHSSKPLFPCGDDTLAQIGIPFTAKNLRTLVLKEKSKKKTAFRRPHNVELNSYYIIIHLMWVTFNCISVVIWIESFIRHFNFL